MDRIHYIAGAILCLALCLSCEKKKVDTVVPTETTRVADDGLIGMEQLLPELATWEDIQYDEHLGYHISFRNEDWEQVLGLSVFIPAQSIPGSFTASRSAIPEDTGWEADAVLPVVLSEIGLPGGSTTTDLIQGECDAVFKMILSLGENIPYSKVTLTNLEVSFPEWFRAEAVQDKPEVVVTAEGAVVTFHLSSIQDPARFVDSEYRMYYTLDISLKAHASVLAEDYIGPDPEMPTDLDFRCSFEFPWIDFTSCGLQFKDFSFQEDRISYLGPLPYFFCGEGADLRFTSPHLLIDYGNDMPFTSSRVDAVAFYDDEYERPKVSFSLTESGQYCFMPKDDGVRREGIQTVVIGAMDQLFCSPLQGPMFARLLLQPVFSSYGTFVPEKEYRMHVTAHWMLPLAFLGHPATDLETPPLVLDNDVLKAAPGNTHQISQEITANLPFDGQITPVFIMEEEEPVFLDAFPIEKNTKVKVTHQFIPKKGHWKAALYYIISPGQGKDELFMKDCGLKVENTLFTAYAPVN